MAEIRWRKSDEAKARDLIARFNRKVYRQRKKGVVKQPETIRKKEFIEELRRGSRAEYNRRMKSLENYLKRGAEKKYITREGVNITVWEKNEIDRAIRTVNARRRAALEKYQPSTYKGTMGTIERANLRPKKNRIQRVLPSEWESFKKSVEKSAKMSDPAYSAKRYKENLMQAVKNRYGKGTLYEIIKDISPEKLVEFYYNEPLLQIDFIYDPHEAEEVEQVILGRLEELGFSKVLKLNSADIIEIFGV